jgi:hypothetical protein
MRNSRVRAFASVVQRLALVTGLVLLTVNARSAQSQTATSGVSQGPSDSASLDCDLSKVGSPYIPVDSWISPAVFRLYSLGYVDTVYLGMRPWTRSNLNHMIEEASSRIDAADTDTAGDEARGIYESLIHAVSGDAQGDCLTAGGRLRLESVYSGARIITGHPLRDSYHIGESIVNDYGRPYANGLNNSSGVSGFATAGRFALYARGEFQGAPSTVGYSSTLADQLAVIDLTTDFFHSTVPIPYNAQSTIPAGPIGTITNVRLIEAYVSAQYLNHVISFGKQDDWLGPAVGGGMAYSNNAENIYSFRINRIEPLQIPLLSRITGPFRYEFLIGPLKGHIYPRDPWLHIEKISFKPTENLEFGFERSVIWGGKGHEPVNLHTFLRSFFSLTNVTAAIKDSPQDPGARFGAFDFSYRLPGLRNWLTLYTDSEAHDDVSPPSAPMRAAYRPGLYLSHVPGIAKLDVRVEAVSTDPPSVRSNGGQFNYYEGIQRQGYTNSGQIIGDWIGREAKGGQGWITYHLSGNEWIQASVRAQKTPKDFIPGGTTLNDINFQVVKRIGRDFEINGNFTYERWKAPIHLPGQKTMTNTTINLTWFPERKVSF